MKIDETDKSKGLNNNKETEARENVESEAEKGEEVSVEDGDRQEEHGIKSTGEKTGSDEGGNVGQLGNEKSINVSREDKDGNADRNNEDGHDIVIVTKKDEIVPEINNGGNEERSGVEHKDKTDASNGGGTGDDADGVSHGGTDNIANGGTDIETDDGKDGGAGEEDSKGSADALKEKPEVNKEDEAGIVDSKVNEQEEVKEQSSTHLEASDTKEENSLAEHENNETNVVADIDPNVNKTENQLVDELDGETETRKSEIDSEKIQEVSPVEKGDDHSVADGKAEASQVTEDDTSADAVKADNENMDKDVDPSDNKVVEVQENEEHGANEEKVDAKEENIDGEETVLDNEEVKENASVAPGDDAQEAPIVFEPNDGKLSFLFTLFFHFPVLKLIYAFW